MLGAVVGSTTLLAGCLGDTEFSITDVRGPNDASEPLSFGLDVLDPDVLVDSPGAFELAVTSDSDEPIELVSQGVRPFGVLELHGTAEYSRSRIRLYSEAYEDSDHLEFRSDGMSIDGEELVWELEPGETASLTFQIWGEWVPNSGGTYALTGRRGDEPVVRYRKSNDGAGAAIAGEEVDADGTNESPETDDDRNRPTGTGVDPDVEFQIEPRSRLPVR